MSRHGVVNALAVVAGLLTGTLLWALVLGARLQRYEPGLWGLRFQWVLACGLDYNGPPFTTGQRFLWLSCGDESGGWQLWPP